MAETAQPSPVFHHEHVKHLFRMDKIVHIRLEYTPSDEFCGITVFFAHHSVYLHEPQATIVLTQYRAWCHQQTTW